MTRIARVGVAFPPDLLRDLDLVVEKLGYRNRSKAIQDAVRLYISEKNSLKEEGIQAGVLMLLYDRATRGLEMILTETQHEHSHIVFATMHIHLGKTECLEAVAVRGEAAEVRKLSDELAREKGVKLLRTMVVAV